jgi:hypothetical protein
VLTHQLVVKAFIKSNKRDDIIEIKPNKKAIKTCLDRGLSTEVIAVKFEATILA